MTKKVADTHEEENEEVDIEKDNITSKTNK